MKRRLEQNLDFNESDVLLVQNFLYTSASSSLSGSPSTSTSLLSASGMREPKPYKCPNCVKSFANNSYLSQHMRIHLGIKPFGPCQYCGKKFTQLSHLQQHIRTHTGEKPYKCKYVNCDKAFSQLSNLQSHSRCHQSDKPFKCNSCYKCFTDEATLLDHIPKHKESKHLKASCAKEKVHICPFCGKSYTQSLYLDKHMTKHAERARASVVSGINTVGAIGNVANINGSLTAADLQRFPKTYYNGDFNPENFDGLNQLNNINQLQNEEFALRQFQMAAVAAQQNAAMIATTTAASAASYATNGSTTSSANASNCYHSSAVNNVVNQIGQQIGNTTLSQLNFFQRSFQRNFAGVDSMQQQMRSQSNGVNNNSSSGVNSTANARNGASGTANTLNNNNERVAIGFNMITPLEEIKHFSQNVANASAQSSFQ